MYKNYAVNKGWDVQIIDSNVSETGGYKEVIAHINGKNVYKNLKYESGVHRVQRVPVTESSGRIHTSTASVAIMPEAREIDIEIKPEDLRIDVMRASGAGGQCVNRTDSAVRITHLPTGIVVSCQETKHQAQNKEKAMANLRSRLYDRKKMEEDAKRSSMRSLQIGSAMRAEKIRTYNFPQNRITDHRIKKSWHSIESILFGNLDELIEDVREGIQIGALNNAK
jgi:peptide chain release factor 1